MTEWVFDPPSPLAGALIIAIAATAFFGGLILFCGAVLTLRKNAYRIGENMGGEHVDVVEWSGREGYVRAGGELWRATSKDALAPGDKVKVTRADGLILDVRKK